MRPEDFAGTTGRVIEAGPEGAKYWAFMPTPLPLEIRWDNALVRALSEADRALGKLSGLGSGLENPYLVGLLAAPFMRREAVLSSQIEGTQADLADLLAYEAGHAGRLSSEMNEDVHEVSNYVRALEYGRERIAQVSLSATLVRELHEILMSSVRGQDKSPGEFRSSQNWIGSPGCTLAQAAYVPPPPVYVRPALEDLIQFAETDDSLPVLVRLALFHYQFEAIHPFLDGNGRVGRLLILLLLVQWGCLTEPLLYLSAFFNEHRRDYYDLLLQVSTKGTIAEWVNFFLRGVASQATDAVRRAHELHTIREDWHGRITAQVRTPAKVIDLANHLFLTPFVTVSRAAEITGMSYNSARGYVDRLVQVGILTPSVEEYGRQFVAHEVLNLLMDPES